MGVKQDIFTIMATAVDVLAMANRKRSCRPQGREAPTHLARTGKALMDNNPRDRFLTISMFCFRGVTMLISKDTPVNCMP